VRFLSSTQVGHRDRPHLGPFLLTALILALAFSPASSQPQFGPPLGAHDKSEYGPRVTRDGDRVVEDTNYDVQNPDLKGNTCFGVAWEKLWHAGQDLYRTDGKSAAGAEVTAVADGKVVYANPDINYPGLVVILEHNTGGETLYSMYAHLDDNSLEVKEGDQVIRGQRLGTVLKQRYTGRFSALHPSGDDSHLHFEVRRFLSARNIYSAAPACNGVVAGRGYTYPAHPGDFPAKGKAYVDPATVTQP
jgi:murein DD-endopeptidase MepM/ murein hydrolase activator NlpD